MSANHQTSVVIAGAGPVGLGLACELGLRGIDWPPLHAHGRSAALAIAAQR